jgi:VWFA-related protein
MTSPRAPVAGLVAASLVALSLTLHAERQRPQEPPGPASYTSIATAILVDVVVRDRQGSPVTDLRAEDFEIREDGVSQAIGSFTRVARGGGIAVRVGVKEPAPTTLVEAPGTKPRDEGELPFDPPVTALVFDALSAEAVGSCQRAALDYLPRSGSAESRVGIFVTEPAVHALQTYTNDPALLRQAVRRVKATGTTAEEAREEREDVLNARRDALAQLGEGALSAQTGTGGALASTSGNIGQLEMERRLVQGELRMLRAFDSLDRDHRGYGTTNALSAVLQSLVELPGRKTLVFFSEGLPASPALQTHLQSVVEAANRSNVTVYAVDASGLRAISGTLETQKEIEEAGKERLRQVETANELTDQPMTRTVEHAEDLMRLDSQGGLARLAEETGGFLVRDTNDLRSAFRRIDEDMRFHYLLTYAPKNTTFDGRFRTIDVKVKRSGVEVFARKGYRALRNPPAVGSLPYEGPALAALDATRLDNPFPFSTAVLSFPDPKRPGLSPLVVRLKTDVLTYREDKSSDAYVAEAAVVVRIKDGSGQIVHRASQQYHLTGRLHELPAAKRGEILFYRQPELPPGVYTMEAAVVDGQGSRTSARVSTLQVPSPDEKARVSSVVLVGKVEQAGEGLRDTTNPLYVGDLLLYPRAGEPFRKAVDRELTFFYAIYPRDGADRIAADVSLRRNGRELARIPTELPAADAAGRIAQVSRLPLAPLTPGTYELAVTVRAGDALAERSAFFRVEN